MISREQILKRLAELQESRQMLLEQLNSCLGNIQDCEYWLAQIALEEGQQPDAAE